MGLNFIYLTCVSSKLCEFILQEEMEETAAKLEKDDEEDFGPGKFVK